MRLLENVKLDMSLPHISVVQPYSGSEAGVWGRVRTAPFVSTRWVDMRLGIQEWNVGPCGDSASPKREVVGREKGYADRGGFGSTGFKVGVGL